MKREYSCSALFIHAKWKCVHKRVEVERNKTLKSRNIKYFKLTIHYFFQKVINIVSGNLYIPLTTNNKNTEIKN
jgi:hypothetical protein